MATITDIRITPTAGDPVRTVATQPHGNGGVVNVQSSWEAVVPPVETTVGDVSVVRSAARRAVAEYGPALERLADD